MMNIKEIYEKFDEIGCLTFATIQDGYPETRIAHLFAYDEEGLYFRTMTVKPFGQQIRDNWKVSICGMNASTRVEHGEDGLPIFDPGFTMKATGDVKEISFEQLQQKAARMPGFELGVKDVIKYPDEIIFCLYKFWGEYYDYDFDCVSRDHKIVREYFVYGGYDKPFAGLKIDHEKCIDCGACYTKCQDYNFKAVNKTEAGYEIDIHKCDVCGNCSKVCPVDAIEVYK